MKPYSEQERALISGAEAAASNWLYDRGYDGATNDQCACLLDARRAKEARAMVLQWQSRCGLPLELTVYKKCNEGIVTLKIPGSAARVNAWGSRKCRAEFAIVLATPNDKPATGKHDPAFIYRAGERVTPDKWDPSPFVECSHGIHFFVTREEAEAY